MHSITFECETITPMFMGSADPKDVELRAPSIKGAMRFWWRAMNAHLSLDELRKQETEIFGGGGNNGRKSNVIIRVQYNNPPNIRSDFKNYYKLNWCFKGKLKGDHAGIGYLLYSMDLNKNEFIDVGYQFKIVIKSASSDALIQALSAFWCAIYFGGFGGRSRRGGGNLEILRVNTK
ncbi:MAG: type III-B CRISPR module RAMP protein Cmr1, partial [Gemmatimonadetes bacterium]